jgi:methylenetetrahydrofolate reductase (NADPH)
VGATRAELAADLDDLRFRGVENVLALRGDPPEGSESFEPVSDGFEYANELVKFIRDRGDLCIGAACYPEVHPEALNAEEDLENLKRKVDAGADFLITQLFFDNEVFLRFRDRAQRAGISIPIVAGIMPILSVKQVKKFTRMCGVTVPRGLLKRIEAVEDDSEAVRHIGMYYATRQCSGLLREGVPGVHFYTLNRSTATRAIYQLIKADLQEEREGELLAEAASPKQTPQVAEEQKPKQEQAGAEAEAEASSLAKRGRLGAESTSA